MIGRSLPDARELRVQGEYILNVELGAALLFCAAPGLLRRLGVTLLTERQGNYGEMESVLPRRSQG